MRKILLLTILMLMLSIITVNGQESPSTIIIDGKIIDSEAQNLDINETIDVKELKPVNNSYNQLIDYSNGYSINYPSDMWVDVSMSPVKTVIANNNTQIEIFYDNFNGTVHYTNGYLYYSNMFLNNRADHHLQERKILNINGNKAQIIRWYRDKLLRVPDDKNYYVSGEIVTGAKEVYTVLIKSDTPIENYKDILYSFKKIPKKGIAKITKEFNLVEKNYNDETREFYEKYFINNDELKWGIYHPSAPFEFSQLKELEEKLKYQFDILVRYQSLDTKVPIEELQKAYEENRIVELTLQTMKMNDNNDGILYKILNGDYDEYFNEYANSLKEFGHPILFRLNNEMNGDWCVYSSYHHSKDTDLYIESWRYIYDIFKENGVDNVIWVWNPNDVSYPDFKWNHYLNYYPGNEYVDVVGLTGYNTGTYYSGEIWRSFDEIYENLYDEYTRVFDHPLMITEFGSNSVGGSKEQWIEEMFMNISKYKDLKIAIWFSGIDLDSKGNPARIYQLDEAEAYVDKFKEGLELKQQ